MTPYEIEVTPEARQDLLYYDAFDRRIVTSEIRVQLTHEPDVQTRNRKALREIPIASWELRAGRFRVFYNVDGDARKVAIIAVGHKEHSALFVRGKEVQI